MAVSASPPSTSARLLALSAWRFGSVRVVGLSEGHLPSVVREDPVLPDGIRDTLTQASPRHGRADSAATALSPNSTRSIPLSATPRHPSLCRCRVWIPCAPSGRHRQLCSKQPPRWPGPTVDRTTRRCYSRYGRTRARLLCTRATCPCGVPSRASTRRGRVAGRHFETTVVAALDSACAVLSGSGPGGEHDARRHSRAPWMDCLVPALSR